MSTADWRARGLVPPRFRSAEQIVVHLAAVVSGVCSEHYDIILNTGRKRGSVVLTV